MGKSLYDAFYSGEYQAYTGETYQVQELRDDLLITGVDVAGEDGDATAIQTLRLGGDLIAGTNLTIAGSIGGMEAGEMRFNGKTIHEMIEEVLIGRHEGNVGEYSRTYDEKLDHINYSMREIEGLFGALSLVINDPAERHTFDTIFNNWKNDKFADRYKT